MKNKFMFAAVLAVGLTGCFQKNSDIKPVFSCNNPDRTASVNIVDGDAVLILNKLETISVYPYMTTYKEIWKSVGKKATTPALQETAKSWCITGAMPGLK